MNSFKIISLVARFPFYGRLNEAVQAQRYRQWIRQGQPVPPPHKAKQLALAELAEKHQLTALVETGTLFGDMIYAMRNRFDAIYSIEVYKPLFARAVRRFRRMTHVKILNGDSGSVLSGLVRELDQPTLFWLDGHYSGEGTGKGEGDTPIFKELEAVFSMKSRFAVAIDDARLFGTDPAYPGIEELTAFIHSRNADLNVTIESDIIRIFSEEAGC